MYSMEYQNASIQTPQQTMEIVLDTISKIIPYELGAILGLEKNNRFKVKYAQGSLYTPKIQDYSISLEDRPELAKVVESGKVHLFSKDKEPHRDTYDEILDLPSDHSCMVAPLHVEGKVLGLLTLDHRKCNLFTSQNVAMIKSLARVASLALAQSIVADTLLSERNALVFERNNLLQNLSHTLDGIVGHSEPWLEVLEKVRLVANTDSAVMILGETGVGKEVVARAIHSLSSRSNRSFIALNCSALVSTLTESELFGHEKGAFTGAKSRRQGRFELAHNGTLFLDEIGTLPLHVQPKLLRALQEGTFERVGGEVSIQSNARIICATNLQLEKAIQEGTFREDLYYRLHVFPIQIPPLRERKTDVLLLAHHFLHQLAPKFGKNEILLSNEGASFLQDQEWPGNVRQLQNAMERAVILSQGKKIEVKHLKEEYSELSRFLLKKDSIIPNINLTKTRFSHTLPSLDEAISHHILKALDLCDGKVYGKKGAAHLLDLKPTTLQSKIKRLNIKWKKE